MSDKLEKLADGFIIQCNKCKSYDIDTLYEFNYSESNFGLQCKKCDNKEYLIEYE